jgi:hypothetical protein
LVAAPLVLAGAQSQQTPPPVPIPIPKPKGQQPAPPPTKPATPPATPTPTTGPAAPTEPRTGKPTEADLGVQIYQGADYLESYDAGKGQRFYLFGTNDAYGDVVAFYKRVRGNGGREVFKAPAMQQFDLDVKFKEDTMAYQPSVVVKDYTWNNAEGYLFVDGARAVRYKTIIQVVPAR